MGMTNMAATIPGFLVPALVGNLTHGVVSFISTSYELKFFFNQKGTLKNVALTNFFSLLLSLL